MHPFRHPAVRRYFVGLGAVLIGAALTDAVGSAWPLAHGGATSVMCTVPLPTAIRARR